LQQLGAFAVMQQLRAVNVVVIAAAARFCLYCSSYMLIVLQPMGHLPTWQLQLQ
jgi:hypothetical protein